MAHTKELKAEARQLQAAGKKVAEISAALGVSQGSVRNWLYGKKAALSLDMAVGTPQKNIEIINGTVIVFSDAHILPNCEYSSAAQALLKVVAELKPNYIVNGGDIFDFSAISRHDKLGWAKSFTVKEELEAGVEFLEMVSLMSKGSSCIMLEGNHDTRFNKMLANKMPAFKGVKGFNLRDHLPKNWLYTMSIMINNNTVFLHAHHGGVHAAYNNTLKGGMSVITGHTHILEVKPITDYNGTRFGVQTGTLATIKNNPLFAYTMGSPLNWQAGFVVLTYIDGVLQYPEVCFINKNDQAVFRGKIV